MSDARAGDAPRVLVAEDTVFVADEIARMLEECGCVVLGPVPTVERAERVAREEDLDAALLDVNLQDQPVFPVAEVLLERQVPFAFLTGYARDSLGEAYEGLPCLEKPFTGVDLARVLRMLGVRPGG